MRNENSDNRGGRRRQSENTYSGEKLRETLSARGLDLGWLRDRTGIAVSSLSDYQTGTRPRVDAAIKIAQALDVPVENIFGDAPVVALPTKRMSLADDFVELDEIDVAYGLGASFVDVPIATKKVTFSRQWLRHFTDSSPEHLFLATGIGESMHPTIHTSDVVIVDRSQATIKGGDQLWALAYGDVGMIKRLRPMPDGSLKILSDNQAVPPEVAYDGEAHLIGRVVCVARKV